MKKNILQSKIFWVQILSLISGILVYLDLPTLQTLGITNSPRVFVIIGMANTILTIILRQLQGTKFEENLNNTLKFSSNTNQYPLDCYEEGEQVFCYEFTQEELNQLPIDYNLPTNYIAFCTDNTPGGCYMIWRESLWQIGGGVIGLPKKPH